MTLQLLLLLLLLLPTSADTAVDAAAVVRARLPMVVGAPSKTVHPPQHPVVAGHVCAPPQAGPERLSIVVVWRATHL